MDSTTYNKTSDISCSLPIRQWLESKSSSADFLEQIVGIKPRTEILFKSQHLDDGQRIFRQEEILFTATSSLPLVYRNCTLYPDSRLIRRPDRAHSESLPFESLLDLSSSADVQKTNYIVNRHEDSPLVAKLRTRKRPCLTRRYDLLVQERRIASVSETTNEESFSRVFADDPNFASLIHRITQANHTCKNVLSDHLHSCYYGSIPDRINTIENYLACQGIDRRQGLILESVNSVPGALTLLTLLHGGYNFLLSAPHHGEDDYINGHSSLPEFLRHRVKVVSELDAADSDLEDPEKFLRTSENMAYDSRLCLDDNTAPKVFLRTSGSLGSPKLVQHSYAKLKSNFLGCTERLELNAGDRISIPVPIFHMYGLGAAFIPGFFAGASLDFQEKANLLRYLARERAFNPNIVFLTPSFCETLLKGRKSNRRFYRFTVSAGERMPERTFHDYESRYGPVINLYGSTELGVIATTPLTLAKEQRATTVGKPLPGVGYRLGNPPAENLKAQANRELLLKHPDGFETYLDLRGNSLDRSAGFDKTWFKTGDLVQEVENCSLRVLGRCNHSMNRNGYLVIFVDVERKMMTMKGIEQVAVVAKDAGDRTGQLIAFCVTAAKSSLTSDDIRAACKQNLPRFAVPDIIIVVRSLPLLPNGKINRRLLETTGG